MKNLIIILVLSLTSCISTSSISTLMGVQAEELKIIPPNSKVIYVTSSKSAADVYHVVKTALIERSHRILKDDKESFYLTTEGRDVGESTLQRMVISISNIDNGSKITITTEYKPGMEATIAASAMSGLTISSDWMEARYETGRPAIAFVESYLIAKTINGSISYK